MNFLKYTECPVSINGEEIFALSAKLSYTASVSPDIVQGGSLNGYSAKSPPSAALELDYYVTGLEDSLSYLTGDVSCTGEFGGIKFSGAYLSSYSVSIQPYVPVQFASSFLIYSGYNSSIESKSFSSEETDFANGAKTQTSNITQSNIGMDNPVSINYSVNCERIPSYVIGSEYPKDVRFGKITRQLSLEGEGIGEFINYSGKEVAEISISPKNIDGVSRGQSINCSGIINSQNLSVSAGGVLNGAISIMEVTR